MRRIVHQASDCRDRGAATVELTLVLPFLLMVLVGTVDFARVFHFSLCLANCARNGAVYGSDPSLANKLPYESITEAALADAQNLSPAPEVASSFGTDSAGKRFVEVTVTYPFRMVTGFPGVPRSMNISRTARMRLTPAALEP